MNRQDSGLLTDVQTVFLEHWQRWGRTHFEQVEHQLVFAGPKTEAHTLTVTVTPAGAFGQGVVLAVDAEPPMIHLMQSHTLRSAAGRRTDPIRLVCEREELGVYAGYLADLVRARLDKTPAPRPPASATANIAEAARLYAAGGHIGTLYTLAGQRAVVGNEYARREFKRRLTELLAASCGDAAAAVAEILIVQSPKYEALQLETSWQIERVTGRTPDLGELFALLLRAADPEAAAATRSNLKPGVGFEDEAAAN